MDQNTKELLAPLLLDYQRGKVGLEDTLEKIEVSLNLAQPDTEGSEDKIHTRTDYGKIKFILGLADGVTLRFTKGDKIRNPHKIFKEVHDTGSTVMFIFHCIRTKKEYLVESTKIVLSPKSVLFDEVHAKDAQGNNYILRIQDCIFYEPKVI